MLQRRYTLVSLDHDSIYRKINKLRIFDLAASIVYSQSSCRHWVHHPSSPRFERFERFERFAKLSHRHPQLLELLLLQNGPGSLGAP